MIYIKAHNIVLCKIEYLLSFLIGEAPETNNSAFIVVICRTIETKNNIAFTQVGADGINLANQTQFSIYK